MSKNIKFEFQGNIYDVQADRQGDILTLVHNGASYQVNLAPGAVTVSNDHVSAVPRSAGAPAAPAAAAPAPVSAAPAAAPAAPASPAPAAAGGGSETAPITGTIKEIKVSQGQAVNSGQLIIIMEAMKMDIEVFASKAGTVQAVLVNPGDSVREKQPLINLA